MGIITLTKQPRDVVLAGRLESEAGAPGFASLKLGEVFGYEIKDGPALRLKVVALQPPQQSRHGSRYCGPKPLKRKSGAYYRPAAQ